MIIFGYHLADSNRIPIHVLIITAKKYTYDSTLSNINLNMRVLNQRFQEIYSDEKLLSVLNDKEKEVEQNWEKVRADFNNLSVVIKG